MSCKLFSSPYIVLVFQSMRHLERLASFLRRCGDKVSLLVDIRGKQEVPMIKAGIENRINQATLVIWELELIATVY